MVIKIIGWNSKEVQSVFLVLFSLAGKEVDVFLTKIVWLLAKYSIVYSVLINQACLSEWTTWTKQQQI